MGGAQQDLQAEYWALGRQGGRVAQCVPAGDLQHVPVLYNCLTL